MHLPLEEYPVIELMLVWYTALLNNPHCIFNNKQWCIPQSSHKWPESTHVSRRTEI